MKSIRKRLRVKNTILHSTMYWQITYIYSLTFKYVYVTIYD